MTESLDRSRGGAVAVGAGVALGSGDPAQLGAILARDIALSVWWRPPPVTPTPPELDGFASVRVQMSVEHVAATVASALTPSVPRGWHAALVADIADLAHRFARIMDVECVEVRLDVLSGNGCWKFHSDYVRARLLTTYLGPGTEWTMRREDDGIGRIHQLGTGHVGLFKGREWAPDAPLLHRSPPIAGTDDVRLLLVIDAVR